jgi:hypothetical protein
VEFFPTKLSPPKSRAESNFVQKSDLVSEALQSPEWNPFLFLEATPLKLLAAEDSLNFNILLLKIRGNMTF